MGCDSVTSSISPEYFVLGKDLPQEDFGKQVLLFGAKTGFSGGAVTGAILLFACGTKLQNGWRNILRNLWIPVVSAILAGTLLPVLASNFDPLSYAAKLKGLLTADQLRHFQYVWWIHSGFYLGLILGLLWMIIRLRKNKG
jgi:predicted benzoate:H+ symporter BenE